MAKSSNEPKVTRITAKDSGIKREKAKAAPVEKHQKVQKDTTEPKQRGRFIEYLKGSWRELVLVRWPDRKSTWKMTGALIMFTLFFVVIILLLDYVFQYVFKLLIG